MNDPSVRAKRSSNSDDQNESLKIDTRCLRMYKQPPGTCAKLYRTWKGIFVVRKVIDVDTYLISLEDDPRKKFIMHRKHLRPLGTHIDSSNRAVKEIEAENVSEETHFTTRDASGRSGDPVKIELEEPELRRSERLKEKSTDFKEFFNSLYEV